MRPIIPMFVASLMASPGFTAQEPNPRGTWMRDDGNARVRIAACGDALCATNLWIRDTSSGEAVGDKLILTLKPESADTLSGNAYDPKRRMNYNISVRVGKKGLVTRGCFVGRLLCKDVYWTPVK